MGGYSSAILYLAVFWFFSLFFFYFFLSTELCFRHIGIQFWLVRKCLKRHLGTHRLRDLSCWPLLPSVSFMMHPLITFITQHFKGLEVISSCFDHLTSLLSTSRYRHFFPIPLSFRPWKSSLRFSYSWYTNDERFPVPSYRALISNVAFTLCLPNVYLDILLSAIEPCNVIPNLLSPSVLRSLLILSKSRCLVSFSTNWMGQFWFRIHVNFFFFFFFSKWNLFLHFTVFLPQDSSLLAEL